MSRAKVLLNIAPDMTMKSYPEPIVPGLANIVNNSLSYGFEVRENGTTTIAAHLRDANHVRMLLVRQRYTGVML